jgi:hypothetical protein
VVSFTFSAEQIRAAPLEVRRWMESQIIKALGPQEGLNEHPSNIEAESLAECGMDEAAQMFRLISHIFPVTQVFFELGRESHLSRDISPLHVLNLEEMQRHVQFGDPRLLAECLAVINQALQRVRNDPQASLFATDDEGHIFIHQTSYDAIRKLREQLLRAHSLAVPQEAQQPSAFDPAGAEDREPALRPEYVFGAAPALPSE